MDGVACFHVDMKVIVLSVSVQIIHESTYANTYGVAIVPLMSNISSS